MRKDCCKSDCLKQMTEVIFVTTRKWFWRQTTSEQNAYIQKHRLGVTEDGHGKEKCVFNGKLICTQAWMTVHGVSRSSKFYKFHCIFLEDLYM